MQRVVPVVHLCCWRGRDFTERAMTKVMPNTGRALAEIGHGFAVWMRRGFERNELRNLSDRDLMDIGLTRCGARREYAKPFWMA